MVKMECTWGQERRHGSVVSRMRVVSVMRGGLAASSAVGARPHGHRHVDAHAHAVGRGPREWGIAVSVM